MGWKSLVDNAGQYGFLGPIVGIAGLLLGAGAAILFGWTRALNEWKPPSDTLPQPLNRMVTLLCAIGVFFAWGLAEPGNISSYERAVLWTAIIAVVAFLSYVGLRAICGRFRWPTVDSANKPSGEMTIWGGFWLTADARRAVASGTTVEAYLAGNLFEKTKVWPASSIACSAVVTAIVLLAALVSGTICLATAATAAQVLLTKKPAREVFSSSSVPGLPATKSPIPSSGGDSTKQR